jgi:hypothetical protein
MAGFHFGNCRGARLLKQRSLVEVFITDLFSVGARQVLRLTTPHNHLRRQLLTDRVTSLNPPEGSR